MQVFAASVSQAVSGFLHAGYISANPREYEAYATQLSMQLNASDALQLQPQGSDGMLINGGGDLVTGPSTQYPLLLLIALSFFALLALFLLLRRLRPWSWRVPLAARRFAPAMLVLLLGLGAATCGEDSPSAEEDTTEVSDLSDVLPYVPPTDAPWEGVSLRNYVDPEAATKVILHGLIADAIINAPFDVETLPNIQDFVRLPKTNLSESEAYAIQTYGIDGWGNPLKLTGNGLEYTVRSAGEDGQFDTEDDLHVHVKQCANDDWEYHRHAHFVRKGPDNQPLVFYHSWQGGLFLYSNQALAESLAGTDLFDLQPVEELYGFSIEQQLLDAVLNEDKMALVVMESAY